MKMKVQSVNYQTNYNKNQNSNNTNPVSFAGYPDGFVRVIRSAAETRVKFKKPTTLQRLKGHRFYKKDATIKKLKKGHKSTAEKNITVSAKGLIEGELNVGGNLKMEKDSRIEKPGKVNVVENLDACGASINSDVNVGGTFTADEETIVLKKVSADNVKLIGKLIGRGLLLGKQITVFSKGEMMGPSRSISKKANLVGGVNTSRNTEINCKKIGSLHEGLLKGNIRSEDCENARLLKEKYPKLVEIMPDGWYEGYLKNYLEENKIPMPEWLSK
jgi:hypothetical protein